MASQYHRLLDPRVLGPNLIQGIQDAFDGGAFNKLELDCRVLKAGSAGMLKLQHAAVNEPDAFRDLGGAAWDLTTGGSHITVSSFLRYLRWVTDGSVAGGPVAMIDLVAKE